MQQKITPNLWFDGNAKEAVDFYRDTFSGTILNTSYYPKEGLAGLQQNLAGKELAIDFRLGNYQFTAINAGPQFKFNPSISFMLNFDTTHDDMAREKLDWVWEHLIAGGGSALMPISEYPFSKRYGWLKDRYGLTWQLTLTDPADQPKPFIVPSLMFSGRNK